MEYWQSRTQLMRVTSGCANFAHLSTGWRINMSKVIVKYRVKQENAQENIDYINKVFEALKQSSPAGLRYASFVLEDGVSFVHIAFIETDDGENPLASLPEFQAFVKDIAARCDEPPQPSVVDMVGSYRAFE